MIVGFILHGLNIFFIQKTALLQVLIVLLAYCGDKIFIYKYCWLLLFIDYIMSSTPIQDLVMSTNAASTSTTSIVRILSSPFIVNGEKIERV